MKKVSVANNEREEKLLEIARAVDEFEVYADSHAERVAELSETLARKFNLAARDRYALRQAALVHDIGEMTMNRQYIKADRRLSDAERIDVERHTVIGEQEAAKRGLSRAVQLLVRWHHESWNGGGYPDAIDREQIPLAARILRVADAFTALTAERPYRAAIAAEEARRHLTEGAGIEFDPKIVKMFLSLEELMES